jgi:dolichyl-phosphate beta-glucosyltransferase
MQETIEISVIIPAFNEERRLPPTLLDYVDYLNLNYKSYEVLVVDDGSSDHTAAVTQKFSRLHPRVRIIKLERNRGKGCAVRTGMLAAVGIRRLFADADGATPCAELSRLEAALSSGSDIAIGSRALSSADTSISTKWYRKYLGRGFNACVNALILPGVADTQCGFKLFSAQAAEAIFSRQTSDGFSFDVEILYLARRLGFAIREVPINWINIPGSKVNLVADSLKMFRDILRFRVIHRAVTRVDLSHPHASDSKTQST